MDETMTFLTLYKQMQMGMCLLYAVICSWKHMQQKKFFEIPDLDAMLSEPLQTVYVRPEDARSDWYYFLSTAQNCDKEDSSEELDEEDHSDSNSDAKSEKSLYEIERSHPGDSWEADAASKSFENENLQQIKTLAGKGLYGIVFAAPTDNSSENPNGSLTYHLKASYPFQLTVRLDKRRLMLCYDCVAFKPSAWDSEVDPGPSKTALVKAEKILGLNEDDRGHRMFGLDGDKSESEEVEIEQDQDDKEGNAEPDFAKDMPADKRAAIKLKVHAAALCKAPLLRFRVPLTNVTGARLVLAATSQQNEKDHACLALDFLHAPDPNGHPFAARICNPRGNHSIAFTDVEDWTPGRVASRASRHFIHGQLLEIKQVAAFLCKHSPWIACLFKEPSCPQVSVPSSSSRKRRERPDSQDIPAEEDSPSSSADRASKTPDEGLTSPTACPQEVVSTDLLWETSPYSDPAWKGPLQWQCFGSNTLTPSRSISASDAPPFRTLLFKAITAMAGRQGVAGVPSLQCLSAAKLLAHVFIPPDTSSCLAISNFIAVASVNTTQDTEAQATPAVKMFAVVGDKASGRRRKYVMSTEEVHALLIEHCGVPEDRLDEVNPCLKRAVLLGHVKADSLRLELVLHRGPCISCDKELTCTVEDALWQSPTGNQYCGSADNGIDCEDCEVNYITGLCCGRPSFEWAKGHNHCTECPDFGTCIGDCRNIHCGFCGMHFFTGRTGFPCGRCQWDPSSWVGFSSQERLRKVGTADPALWDGHIEGSLRVVTAIVERMRAKLGPLLDGLDVPVDRPRQALQMLYAVEKAAEAERNGEEMEGCDGVENDAEDLGDTCVDEEGEEWDDDDVEKTKDGYDDIEEGEEKDEDNEDS